MHSYRSGVGVLICNVIAAIVLSIIPAFAHDHGPNGRSG